MVELTTRPGRGDRVLAQRAGDSLILLDPANGYYYALDDVGARIWELCDGARSVGDIVDVISCEYNAPAATIADDALELLNELVAEKLVRNGTASP